ncbi:MAG: excisionase family DNA-binding protein [Luteolibacter sp.]
MDNDDVTAPRTEKLALFWESEVIHETTPAGESRATVVARRPLSRMSVKQAAKLLGCTAYTVRKAFRSGRISGWKPGAVSTRKDGRTSNAALVLDAGSVLAYKQSVTQRGEF